MRRTTRTRKIAIIALCLLLLCSGTVAYVIFKSEDMVAPAPSTEEPAPEPEPQEPEEPTPALINVQPTIDAWSAKQSGKHSIVVYDLENNKTIGSHQPDEVYFAASIYKLYVAYEGYLALQRSEYQVDQLYQANFSYGQCLIEMIRQSYSPCAEKLWAELGKEQTTAQLKTYGLTNTNMSNITTTAQDAATMLARIWQGDELSEGNKATLLKSMAVQVYRDALASGFAQPNTTFYDKVGFRGYDEYHDVGILELPNDRHYVVSVLSTGVGTRALSDLASQLYTVLSVEDAS